MEDKNFEEMRQQMAILKEHLAQQEIVSGQQVREIMKVKTGDIKKIKNSTIGAAVACLFMLPLTAVTHMWSWAFAIATAIMMVFCVLATDYIHRPVEKLNLMTDDLASVARVMAKFKKQYNDWLRYVAPALLLPWLIWACYEIAWKHAPAEINPWLIILPMILSVAIGGLIGFRNHTKAVNAAQDIMNQIEEQ